jgi:hypothetical protein
MCRWRKPAASVGSSPVNHAWRYDLDGNLTFVQQEEEFFDLDKSRYGLVSVHCDVWQGFIFVNFANNAEPPEQTLRDFPGPMITGIEEYPFSEMTSRFYYRSAVKANWKLYMDAFQEFYHAPVLHASRRPSCQKPRRRPDSRLPTTASTARTGWSAHRVSGRGKWTPRCTSRSRTSARVGCSGHGTNPIWETCRRDSTQRNVILVPGLVPAVPEFRHPMSETQAFCDAITPRAEEAISFCDKFPLDDMPEDVLNLMHLLYSMIMVSFPIECWKQPRVPDSGAATLDCLSEPVP